MSTSVSGIEHGKRSPSAARRWIVRAIATAAALLFTALAAAPARADDTVGTVLSATTIGSPPASYGDTTAPPDNAPQSNTATNMQTATATGGAGGSATGGNAGPSQVAGDGSQGGSNGGNAYANGGNAESHNSLENKQSNQTSGRDGSGPRFTGGGTYDSGQDTFVLEKTNGRRSDRTATRTHNARSRGHFESSTTDRASRTETNERGGRATGKASPLHDGLPGHGGQLPSQNPFFSLLSGSGGAGTGLLLLLLAVLAASIPLPNHRFKAFRTPPVPWRPLAYVPPIELPG